MTTQEEFDVYLQEAAHIISEGLYAEDVNSVVSTAATRFKLTQKQVVCIKIIIFNLAMADHQFEDPTHKLMSPIISVCCNTVAHLLMNDWDKVDIFLSGILDEMNK